MSTLYVIFIAFALAMDAFTVALATGAYFRKTTPRQRFRLSFHFGLFQFLMPILGWLTGSRVVTLVGKYDHWIAFVILLIIGIRMIVHAVKPEATRISQDMTSGFILISLSVATSIDALAVGFSIGIIKDEIVIPSIIIGLVAAGMTLLGMKMGEFLSERFGQKISALGGLVLIAIGVHIVLDHMKIIP